SRPRDLDWHTRDGSARHPEVFEVSDIGVGDGGEKPARGRTLQRERGDLLRDVLDANVEADGILREPPQAWIRCRPPERLLGGARHRTVVDHLAVLVAPRRV